MLLAIPGLRYWGKVEEGIQYGLKLHSEVRDVEEEPERNERDGNAKTENHLCRVRVNVRRHARCGMLHS